MAPTRLHILSWASTDFSLMSVTNKQYFSMSFTEISLIAARLYPETISGRHGILDREYYPRDKTVASPK